MHLRASGLAFAVLFVLAGPALGQSAWPARAVTLIVGYPAGSGTDRVARFLADGLRERTGQPFVVENRPGALGNIAAQTVARAAPDGNTVLFTPNSSHGINPHLFRDKGLGFDPIKDFQPVTSLMKVGFLLVVNPQTMPVRSVGELTAYAKERPNKLSYASGNATGQVAAELYRQITGIDAVHVPYKGVPPAVTDLLGGQVHFMFADVSFALGVVRSGKLRALAVTTEKRLPSMPDIPTMMEAGVPNYVVEAWMGLLFPAGAPAEATHKLADMANSIVTSEKGRDFLAKLGAEPFPGSPAAFAATIRNEIAKWEPVVKAAGMTGAQ